jgi:hypothetical protein
MPVKKEDKLREDRIMMEIVVDAHDSEERAMGWSCYLENTLRFSFAARCTGVRASSPLEKGDEVEVMGMADLDDCQHEMFVMIRHERKRGVAVPLAQLKGEGDCDEGTRRAVEDWRYWVKMGYEF